MEKTGYFLLRTLTWIFQLFPLRVHYLLSNFLFFLAYYVFRYRRSVVKKNLSNSFPEKSSVELACIEKKFYRHFADTFIETLYFDRISVKEGKSIVKYLNPELLESYLKKDRQVIVILGHYNNWEWFCNWPLYSDYRFYPVYKRLKSKVFEKFYWGLRSHFGAIPLERADTYRQLLSDHKRGIALRSLLEAAPSFYEHDDDYEGAVASVIGNEYYASGVTEQQQDEFLKAQEGILKAFADETSEAPEGFTDTLTRILLATLEQHQQNPLVVANIFECAFFSQETQLTSVAEEYLKSLAAVYPIAQLTLAFAAIVTGKGMDAFEEIYNSESLAEVYPDKNDLGACEIATYSLLHTLVSLGDDDLNTAIRNYYIAAETEIFSWMLPAIQVALADAINNVIAVTEALVDEVETENGDETGDDADSVDDGEPTLRIV